MKEPEMKQLLMCCIATGLLAMGSVAQSAEWGLKKGSLTLQSAGTLTFGPDGILFIGDAKAAAVVAIDTRDAKGSAKRADVDIENVNKRVAGLFDSPGSVISDLAVNPLSGNIYVSVKTKAGAALVRIDGTGKLSRISLSDVLHAQVDLPGAPEDKVVKRGRRERNLRNDSVTDLAWVDGKVIVSGLSNSKSAVREIAFPFVKSDTGSSIEIYHGAHGKLEDYSAIRTFVPFNIDGEPSLLAGYVCTPLVKFPLKGLKAGEKTRGTTIAELGNRNRPLDMIVYEKGGQEWLLLANSARGIMKISTKDIAKNPGINKRISGTAGQPYDIIPWDGVVQLDKQGDGHAVILVQDGETAQHLKTVELP
jgi:hypothetical protein